MDNRASGAQRGHCTHTRDAKWQCRAHINASPFCGYLPIGDSLGTLMCMHVMGGFMHHGHLISAGSSSYQPNWHQLEEIT
jgi:hypothetical protein